MQKQTNIEHNRLSDIRIKMEDSSYFHGFFRHWRFIGKQLYWRYLSVSGAVRTDLIFKYQLQINYISRCRFQGLILFDKIYFLTNISKRNEFIIAPLIVIIVSSYKKH